MQYGTSIEQLDLVCAVDTETTGLNSWTGDRVFMVTFCDAYGKKAAVYWDVDPFTREPRYEAEDVASLKRFFKNKKRTC
ncbi:MAG: hypothetical protein WC047_08575, partial [Kiritimatiellales bacterium]